MKIFFKLKETRFGYAAPVLLSVIFVLTSSCNSKSVHFAEERHSNDVHIVDTEESLEANSDSKTSEKTPNVIGADGNCTEQSDSNDIDMVDSGKPLETNSDSKISKKSPNIPIGNENNSINHQLGNSLLLSKNNSINLNSNGYFTSRIYLSKRKYKEFIDTIRSESNFRCIDKTDTSIIYTLASCEEYFSIFSSLLDYFIENDKYILLWRPSDDILSALEYMVYNDNLCAFKMVCNQGKVNQQIQNSRDKLNNNLLHYSLFYCINNDISKILIKNCPALLNNKNNLDLTPLELICIKDNVSLIEHIVNNKMFKNSDYIQSIINLALLYKGNNIINYLLNELGLPIFYKASRINIHNLLIDPPSFKGLEIFEEFKKLKNIRKRKSIELMLRHIDQCRKCDFNRKSRKMLCSSYLSDQNYLRDLIYSFFFDSPTSEEDAKKRLSDAYNTLKN